MSTEKIQLILLIGLLVMGYSWNIVIPQTIQIELRQQPYNFTSWQFNLLYFSIFLPVFVFSVPFSSLFKKLRFSWLCLTLEALSFIFTTALAFLFTFQSKHNKILIIFCRGFFGLFNQGIIILRSLIVARYFKKRYEQILSIYFAVAYFVSSGTLLLSPILYDKYKNINIIFYVGCLISLFSLIGGFFVYLKLQKLDQKLKQQTQKKGFIDQEIIEIQQIKIQQIQSTQQQALEINLISNWKNPFWIIVFTVLFTLLAIFPITDNLNQGFVVLYNMSQITIGFLMTIANILNGVLLLLVGVFHSFLYKIKRRLFLISSALYFISLVIIQLLPSIKVQKEMMSPDFYFIFVAFLLVSKGLTLATLWGFIYTSIVFFLKQVDLGVGYGILQAMLGFGQCIGPLINSFLLNKNENLQISYKYFFKYYLCISAITILASFWIKIRPQFDIIDSINILNLNQDFNISQNQTIQSSSQRKKKSWLHIILLTLLLLGVLFIILNDSNLINNNIIAYKKDTRPISISMFLRIRKYGSNNQRFNNII